MLFTSRRLVIMNEPRKLLVLAILLLICCQHTQAQPGACYPGFGSSTFNPLRTCNPSYVAEEFVFVGRVVSQVNTQVTHYDEGFPRGLATLNITVDTQIKGKLERNFRLYMDLTCSTYIEPGEKRIFTARRVVKPGFDGIVSYQRSTSLKDISESDLAAIINDIRSMTRGEKQPRITGKVIQYDSSPDSVPGFWGKFLDTLSGYDPDHSRPLKGIEVFAKSVKEDPKSGKPVLYKTRTNPDGVYEFKDLPEGSYEIYPVVPAAMSVRAYIFESHKMGELYENSFKSPIQGEKTYVRVEKGACSLDVRFNARAT